MKVVKLQLMSKNNLQRGSYLYSPIIQVAGEYWRCSSIRSTGILKLKNVDVTECKISTKIRPESYAANGLS